VDERSERVRTLLEDWRKDPADGTELAAVLDDFTDALVEHLDDEEVHAVPLIRPHHRHGVGAVRPGHFREVHQLRETHRHRCLGGCRHA
jgi:hypothetical protein